MSNAEEESQGAKQSARDSVETGFELAFVFNEDEYEAQAAGRERSREGLQCIFTSGRLTDSITADAIVAIKQGNDPPRIFLQGRTPVRIERCNGRVVVMTLTPDLMRNECSKAANWIRWDEKKKKCVYATTPPRIGVEVLSEPNLPFTQLRGVVTVPYFTRGGDLVRTNGYNADSELYLEVEPGLTIPPVSANPCADEVAESVAMLDDLIGDFPFDSDASRAHALAFALLPFVREMIQGPTPLQFFDAPAPGTGKSLLAKVLMIPGCGDTPETALAQKEWSHETYCNEEEIRKTITALLQEGRPAVRFDNVKGRIDSASIAALLTGTTWSGRILGSSAMVSVPNRTLWAMTGNNFQLSDEIARRTVWIRLDAQVERPQCRPVSGFRHADIVAYAMENRGRLARCCLTMIVAWIYAGQPAAPIAPRAFGSFFAWSQVMSGVLAYAGVPGFLENAGRLVEVAVDENADICEFVLRWFEKYGSDEVSTRALLPCGPFPDAWGIAPGALGDEKAAMRLGTYLGKHRGRVYAGNLKIAQTRTKAGRKWALHRLGTAETTVRDAQEMLLGIPGWAVNEARSMATCEG